MKRKKKKNKLLEGLVNFLLGRGITMNEFSKLYAQSSILFLRYRYRKKKVLKKVSKPGDEAEEGRDRFT